MTVAEGGFMDGMLVVARYGGYTLSGDGECPYRFACGESGALLWKADDVNRNAWIPYVLWDRDPDHLPRQILLRAVLNVAILE